jgi:DNA-binding response OmpR family regulator
MSSNTMAPEGIELSTRLAKVLLVDEDASDLRYVRIVLEGQGFEVLACNTYEAGLQYLETTPFDFVVVSQGTQAFEGRPVLDRALQLDRHRPVLVITRSIDMCCYLDAMQMGAVDYIEKPVPPDDLVTFVRAHVNCERVNMQESAA